MATTTISPACRKRTRMISGFRSVAAADLERIARAFRPTNRGGYLGAEEAAADLNAVMSTMDCVVAASSQDSLTEEQRKDLFHDYVFAGGTCQHKAYMEWGRQSEAAMKRRLAK